MLLNKRTIGTVALAGLSLALMAVAAACSGKDAEPSAAPAGQASEPDVTFYLVAFHWGWAVFDEEGNELDGIRVPEGTTVEIYAVNDAAQAAMDQFPAAVAEVVRPIDWHGARAQAEIETGRLPDPELLLGMSLEDIEGDHGDMEGEAHGHDDAGADGHGEAEMPDDADGHDDGDMPESDVHEDDDMHETGDIHDEDEAHQDGDMHEASDADEEGEVSEGDAHDEGGTMDEHMDRAAWQIPWEGEERALETHGFLIPWYGVAKKLPADAKEPVRVVFTADRAGTFEFVCTVYCGYGHRYQPREMLYVEPRS